MSGDVTRCYRARGADNSQHRDPPMQLEESVRKSAWLACAQEIKTYSTRAHWGTT